MPPIPGLCCCSPATTSHQTAGRGRGILARHTNHWRSAALHDLTHPGLAHGPVGLEEVFEPSKVPERVKREFPFSMLLRPSQIGATAGDAAQMVPAATSLARHYGQLTIPVAIMAGRGDKIIAISPHPRRLHATISVSTLQLMDAGAHDPSCVSRGSRGSGRRVTSQVVAGGRRAAS